MIIPIRKGLKVCSLNAIDKIRTLDEEFLVKLFFHTNDPIQEALIVEICKLKGYTIPQWEPEITPEPPRYA